MDGMHIAQNFLLPTSFSRMQNTFPVDILNSAAIVFQVKLLSSSGTPLSHSTYLSSIVGADVSLQAAPLTSSCQTQIVFMHQQTVLYDGT
jgi:hypothetical protein